MCGWLRADAARASRSKRWRYRLVHGQLRGQDLDGHGAVEPHVPGPVDLPHAPGAEGSVDLVRPETVPERAMPWSSPTLRTRRRALIGEAERSTASSGTTTARRRFSAGGTGADSTAGAPASPRAARARASRLAASPASQSDRRDRSRAGAFYIVHGSVSRLSEDPGDSTLSAGGGVQEPHPTGDSETSRERAESGMAGRRIAVSAARPDRRRSGGWDWRSAVAVAATR